MGWFRRESEESKIIDIKTRKAIKSQQRPSSIEEEGEFVTIALNEQLMPEITFTDERAEEEKEDVSTNNISDISE
tara:strand:- start:553 stop:777 length:225 start_codon:yes stop_codon:yes gene_type:complete